MKSLAAKKIEPQTLLIILGGLFFAYLFFGFMLMPCLNTLTSIFNVKNADGTTDPFAVIKFFLAGTMGNFVWNSLKLAICLVITVNVVGISIVLLTEYFDIKGAKILRMGYMTTLIYSGVALVTGYMFLYDNDGIITTLLVNAFPDMNPNWFSGFNAVLFTMTFACTSNHMLFLRNAIRGIDYNTVEAARNMGANPFKVLWKIVLPTLLPTLFSLTIMTFITGLCAMSAPTLLGYDSINPEIVRLAGSSTADESFPQARAALLSIILATFTIVLLTVLSAYERKGHYLSVSKTKAKLQKQKGLVIQNVLMLYRTDALGTNGKELHFKHWTDVADSGYTWYRQGKVGGTTNANINNSMLYPYTDPNSPAGGISIEGWKKLWKYCENGVFTGDSYGFDPLNRGDVQVATFYSSSLYGKIDATTKACLQSPF